MIAKKTVLQAQTERIPKMRNIYGIADGFAAWRGLIEHYAYLSAVTGGVLSHLRVELEVIKRRNLADFFWFVYNTALALRYHGGGFVAGELERFSCLRIYSVTERVRVGSDADFSFLDGGLPTVIFAVAKGGAAWLTEYLRKTYGEQALASVAGEENAYCLWACAQIKIMEREDL